MDITANQLLNSNFVKVKASDSVSEMLGALGRAKQTSAVVFDDSGNYLGLSSRQDVLRKRTDFSRLKVGTIVEKKPFVPVDASLQQIAELMVGSDSKLLPVFLQGKVAGVVFAIDVVKQIKSIAELKILSAKDVASLNPVVLQDDCTFGNLVSLMQETHISKVPIVNKNNALKGIVSFSDLMESYLSVQQKKDGVAMTARGKSAHDIGKKQKDLFELPVSNWVVENVRTVSMKDSVSKIIDAMLSANISDVVVVEKNKIAGIVTLWDLLECFVRLKKERKNIQFVNLPELDEIDLQFLNNAVLDCFDKLRKVLGQVNYFVVHFKFLEHEGLRKKTFVRLRISAPGKFFVASSDGWVLLDAVHDAIKNLEREVFDSSKK